MPPPAVPAGRPTPVPHPSPAPAPEPRGTPGATATGAAGSSASTSTPPLAPVQAVASPTPGTAVQPAAPADTGSVNVMQVIPMVADGNVSLELPGIAGSYGSGLESFTVAPGLRARMVAVVRNGEIVPGATEFVFEPPLDNALWITTPRFTLNSRGEIIASLTNFPDMNITKSVLGVDRLPLNLNQLYTLLNERADAMAAQAASSMGNPFDVTRYRLNITNATLLPGQLPVPGATVQMGAGTRVNISSDRNNVHINGNFRLARFDASANGSHLDIRSLSADGQIDLRLDDSGRPTRVTTNLTHINGRLQDSVLSDGTSTLNVASVALADARLSLCVDLPESGAPRLQLRDVNFPAISTRITGGALAVPVTGASDTTPHTQLVRLADASFSGSVGLDSNGQPVIDARTTTLNASADNITFGAAGSNISLDYAQVGVMGSGRVVYGNGRVDFSGTLQMRGTIQDGRFGQPGGPFFADFAPGTSVDVNVTQAGFGGGAGTFTGSGRLEVRLDRGSLNLPGISSPTLTRGTSAIVDLQEVSVNAAGQVRARGGLTINAHMEAPIDVAAVNSAAAGTGIRVTRFDPVTGDASLNLTGIELNEDGSFAIGPSSANVDVRISRIRGRLPGVTTSSLTAGTSSAAAAMTVGTDPSLPTFLPPSLSTMLGAVNTASIRFAMPLPSFSRTISLPGAGLLGSLGAPTSVTVVYPPTPTRMSSNLVVNAGGAIDFACSSISFSPALPAIGPAAITGVRFDSRGHIIANVSRGPDIDLTEWVLDGVAMPSLVTGIPAFASAISSSAAGTILRGSTGVSASVGASSHPLDIMRSLGITFDITNASLNSTLLPLSTTSSLTIDPSTRFAIAMSGGTIVMTGTAAVSGATIREPGVGVDQFVGTTSISVRVDTGNNVAVDLAGLSGTATRVSMARNTTDVLNLSTASLRGGNISIAIPTSGSVRATGRVDGTGSLAPSSMAVVLNRRTSMLNVASGNFDGTVAITGGAISGSARITNLAASTGAIPLALGATTLDVSEARLTASDVNVTFGGGQAVFSAPPLAAGTTRRTGGIDVSASLSAGSVGHSSSDFHARFGAGTQANLHFDELQLGGGHIAGVSANGRGFATVRMLGGHLILNDGEGNPIRLDIQRGTGGRVDFGRIETTAGASFATLRGALRFTARLSTRIPREGIELAPGVRLTAIDNGDGTMEVSIGGLAVEPNGTFALGDIHLRSALSVEAARGTMQAPPPPATTRPAPTRPAAPAHRSATPARGVRVR